MMTYVMACCLCSAFMSADYLRDFPGFSFMSVVPIVWNGSGDVFSTMFHTRYGAEKSVKRLRLSGVTCSLSVVHVDDAWIVVPRAWARRIRRGLSNSFDFVKTSVRSNTFS
ncbi:MAG: hypothetical protein [Microviridae sp.]|nr:MAG: hypothetical protein [Microviridae sp.]